MSGDTKKPRTRWGTGRIAVSAKWPEIAAALKADWPMTMIFEKHMGGTGISYSQFRRQVHRLQKVSDAPPASPTDQANETTKGQTASVRKTLHEHSGTVDPDTLRKLTRG